MPTPLSGSFIALAGAGSSVGDWVWSFVPGDDIVSVSRPGDADTAGTTTANYNLANSVIYTPSTTEVILNSGTPNEESLAVAGLPLGFNITSLKIRLRCECNVVGDERKIKFWYNGGVVGDYLLSGLGVETFEHVIDPVPSVILTFARDFGFNADGSSAFGGDSGFTLWGVWLEGTYNIPGLGSWYIKPTVAIIGGLPINTIANIATDIIRIEEGDLIPKGYEFWAWWWEFDDIIYYWWETIDAYQIYVNSPIPPGPRWTRYSGVGPPSCVGCRTIMLNGLEVLVADASGIYVLTPQKKTDTLYDRASETTINVKIPNPSAKTGFLP